MSKSREVFGLATLMCSSCGDSFPVGARQHKNCRGGSARNRPRECTICGDSFRFQKERLRKGKYRLVWIAMPGKKIAAHKLAHILADD